jgi:Ca-activated chloride channel family protein
MQTTLSIDHQAHTGDEGTVVRVLLTLTGELPPHATRAPIGLSLVLDRSGSMHGLPLECVREAAARAVERLHPQDVVGAVAFDSDVDEIGAAAPAQQQSGLSARLRALESRGNTNLSGGWLRGRQQMVDAGALLTGAGSSRRVVLLTDGHANEGITDPDLLIGLARTARAQGMTTSTVGVGDGYDDTLLRAMADAGGGNAWYIEHPDQSQDVFAEELGALLSVSAQGVTATLTLQPSVQMLLVHSDWPVTPSVHGLRFDLGDLYASEPKPLLFELFVPRAVTEGFSADALVTLATLSVRADVLTGHGSVAGVEHRELTLPIAATAAMQTLVVPEVEAAVLLARTARHREDAAAAQRRGDSHGAHDTMREARRVLEASPLLQEPAHAALMQQQLADLEALEAQYRRGELHERDAKYQMQRAYNMKRGKRNYDQRLNRP